jgi:hypothetical protein
MTLSVVMPGLVLGIHAFPQAKQAVAGRDNPGHDENKEQVMKLTRPRNYGALNSA